MNQITRTFYFSTVHFIQVRQQNETVTLEPQPEEHFIDSVPLTMKTAVRKLHKRLSPSADYIVTGIEVKEQVMACTPEDFLKIAVPFERPESQRKK